MIIKDVHYQMLPGWISAEIDGQNIAIPDIADNRYRMIIAEWEDEGNEIAPFQHLGKGQI